MTSPRFWNFMARGYARRPVADAAAYEHKLKVTRGLLRADMEVLEFGCGTGTTALIHAPNAAGIDAIDYSPRMIEIARAKPCPTGNVRFSVARIEDWPAPPGSYDMIMAHSILHLVDDPARVMARVADLLKPGGLFVSSTVCLGGMARPVAGLLAAAGWVGVLPRLNRFTEQGVADLITGAGLAVDYRWSPGADKAVFITARKA